MGESMLVYQCVVNEDVMTQLAKKFASCLRAPLLVTFKGDMGAGKTTFIRAMLRALGVVGPIRSPTFSLVESYMQNDLQIHHFDLYRIQDEVELEYLGFRDFFTDQAICCIEWPERAAPYLEKADIQCSFTVSDDCRTLDFSALTASGEMVLACAMK